jgi:predicted Rossmann fold flavoprotein
MVEGNASAGRKLDITGGGRCNILPLSADPADFGTSSSRNSLRRILRSWSPEAARAFLERTAGLPVEPEAGTGKLFPASQRARDVRQAILGLALSSGARLLSGHRVDSVRRGPGGSWEVCSGSVRLTADRVVLATGGCSWPETGSDGSGFRMARDLGHHVHPPRPALVPLTSSDPRWPALAGLTLRVTVMDPAGMEISAGNLLVTHSGFSGPAILDASHLWEGGLRVRWCARDARSWDELLRSGRGRVLSAVREEIPERLAVLLMECAGLDPRLSFSDLRKEGRSALVSALASLPLPLAGTAGWEKAEVTAGGVALEEVRPDTLESRICPGLFLAGEILDCCGPVGGYNLYWAFLTGRLAGLGAASAEGRRPEAPD